MGSTLASRVALITGAAAAPAAGVDLRICDVTDESALAVAVDAVAAEHGAIDMRVNCAGVAGAVPRTGSRSTSGSASCG